MSSNPSKPAKKGQALFAVLKAMTIAEVPLLLVPGIFLSVSLFGRQHFDWKCFWIGLLCLAVVTVLASLLGAAAVRYDRRKESSVHFDAAVSASLKILAYAVSPAVCLGLTLLVWPVHSLLGWISGFVVLELCWIYSVQRVPGSYTQSFDMSDVIKCAGVYLVPIGALKLMEANIPVSYDIMPMAFSFCVFIMMGYIIMNQQNIDLMMERRRHDKTSLPGKIRVYNLMLVAALLILVFSGLFFANQIGAALIWVLKKVGLLFIYVFVFLIWLASLGKGQDSGGNGGGGISDLSGLAQDSQGSNWWNLLLILLIAVLVYLIVSNRKRIWEAICGFFSKLAAALYHFFLDCFKIQELGSAEGYYTEEIEELDREERPTQPEGFRSRYAMKKALRHWRKTPDPVERVREGYRLLLMAYQTQKKAIASSDTTGQILMKNRGGALEDAFTEATPVYDQVRYDGSIPDAAVLSGFAEKVEESCLAVNMKKKQ